MKKYLFEIEYRDNRVGDLRRTEKLAEDEGEAVSIAQEDDYYWGGLLNIEKIREVEKQEWALYD